MTIEAKQAGIRIEPIFKPKVHAKIVAWDNDYVVTQVKIGYRPIRVRVTRGKRLEFTFMLQELRAG
jgi:hypothetical protein